MNNQNPDSYNWDKVVKALEPLPEIKDAIVKLGEVPDKAAPLYEAFTVTLPDDGQPYLLLGFDPARTRALVGVVSSVNAAMTIGKRSQLAAGSSDYITGFVMQSGVPVELKTQDEIWARVDTTASQTGVFTVWVEKVAN